MMNWERELEDRAQRVGFQKLRGAVESLSQAYRDGKPTKSPHLDAELTATAYLATRFPATLAAARRAAQEIAKRYEMAPESLIDLGAGCGAALLAFREVWPSLKVLTAIEHSPAMCALGRTLVPEANWRTTAFSGTAALGQHDIAVFSYSLNEAGADTEAALAKAWASAAKLLVVIEPGTPAGFDIVHEARQWLIANGASLVAPCPRPAACPAAGTSGDWCHFAARLNRSSLHRRLKDGSLGHEDEKFSYVAATREPVAMGPPRIVRHPLIEPGRITFQLCDAPDRPFLHVTKRQKPWFRLARKLTWGDSYDPTRVVDDTASADLEPGDG